METRFVFIGQNVVRAADNGSNTLLLDKGDRELMRDVQYSQDRSIFKYAEETLKTLFSILFLLIVCTACRNEHSSEPVSQTPIQKWQSRIFHNYTIDQRRSCFCPNGGELVRITVHADTIALVQRLSDSSIVQYPYYRTVDSLFAIILNPGTDSLVIRYNDQYGYPEYLDVNPQLHPVDGGFLYETSNLVVL